MTLYRTSGDSPIVRDLIRAAERGKQVVVLVEIKARFDEEANIVWARKLEQAGAHVVYGLVGLKTHSKVALVVRREGSGPPPLRPHRHRQLQPEDRPALHGPRPALVPAGARRRRHRPVQRPDRPVAAADVPPAARRAAQPPLAVPRARRARDRPRRGRPRGADRPQAQRDRRRAVDRGALPRVAGRRRVDIIARGGLLAAAGRQGRVGEHPVRSIVGEFLEHSRIWGFANGGEPDWYIGSADLMDRNLDRRVEAMVPVEDADARARIAEIIEVMLADDRRSWQLGPTPPGADRGRSWAAPGTCDTHEELKARALAIAARAAAPRRPGAGAGSLDPRA